MGLIMMMLNAVGRVAIRDEAAADADAKLFIAVLP